jgi:ferrous iron transport protein B
MTVFEISQAAPVIVVVGNPNAGKTTVFNHLTGSRQRVGNYPGVTVEHTEGRLRLPSGRAVRVIDVPGCYSLAAQSPEETIAHEVILGRIATIGRPALIVNVIDATNLSRNLYLTTQLLEMGRPLVLAVTMTDVAKANNYEVDFTALSETLGCPAVPLVASKGLGMEELRRAIEEVLTQKAEPAGSWRRPWRLEERCEEEVERLGTWLETQGVEASVSEGEAIWLLSSQDDNPDLGVAEDTRQEVRAALERIRNGDHPGAFRERVISARYAWIDELCGRVVSYADQPSGGWAERVDAFLMHRWWGLGFFAALMFLVFQALFSWSDPLIGGVEDGLAAITGVAAGVLPPGLFTDLLLEGVLAGVGNVLVFLPQILMLFFFIALLEDSGYMARAAFLMQRVMGLVGLHGKAFIPLLSSLACAVPGVLATRTLEKKEDRLVTILVIPLMSCSARLPVYSLVIATLFAGLPPIFGIFNVGGLLLTGLYFLSISTVLLFAFLFKRYLIRGARPSLFLEMPSYKLPSLRNVLRILINRTWIFTSQAGTIILAMTIVLWFLFNFPRQPENALVAEDAAVAAQMENSMAGQMGRFIEPVIAPLGFDWKVGIGLIASFAAREVFVSTLGMLYGANGEDAEDNPSLREALRAETDAHGRRVFTPLTGLSILVFFVLACQCMATLAVVKRETASWKYPVFLFAYMTTLAYVGSLVVYQGGRLLGFE